PRASSRESWVPPSYSQRTSLPSVSEPEESTDGRPLVEVSTERAQALAPALPSATLARPAVKGNASREGSRHRRHRRRDAVSVRLHHRDELRLPGLSDARILANRLLSGGLPSH